MNQITFETPLDHPAETVFRWHARPGALERLTPPWERVEVIEEGGIADGARTTLSTRSGPLRHRWVAEHHLNGEPYTFRDEQVEGPFASWVHLHQVRPESAETCTLIDRVRYELPLGALGRLFGGRYVEARLERLFAYRHRVLAADVTRHAGARGRSLRVGVTGSSGLVGSGLVPFLTSGGHEVVRLPRSVDDPRALEGLDAVVHLAGESLAEGRWTRTKKERIRSSRVEGTRRLCETLTRMEDGPGVLVSASAIGFYGDRAERVDESSPAGTGFLADVCRAWERATEPARAAGIRVVNLRLGVVLSPRGGALARMLVPFRLGLGGRLGSGEQWMSWIALDDLLGVLHRALVDDSLAGPVNAVSPHPVTNAQFARTLGRVLERPALAPVPATAARCAFGEMAEELLLASTRVTPRALTEAGFDYDQAVLEDALRHALGRTGRTPAPAGAQRPILTRRMVS